MNAHRSASRRPRHTPTLAPVARAIRAALAGTALALFLPTAALATSPVAPAKRVALPATHAAMTTALHDPALVDGAPAPSSVHGRQGTHGDVSAIGQAAGAGGAVHAASTLVNHDDLTVVVDDGSDPAYAAALGFAGADATVTNDGTLSATAIASGGFARARGIDAFGNGTGVSVANAGDTTAIGQADGGRARASAIYAFAYGSTATVDNVADLTAVALADGGFAYATGIEAVGYGGDAIVTNAGGIDVSADAAYAYAIGVFDIATRGTGRAYTGNTGTLDAHATGNLATAAGAISIASRYGDADIANAGAVSATANGTYGASAHGLYNQSLFGNAALANDGTVDVLAESSDGIALAFGLENAASYASYYGDPGSARVTNSGDVSVVARAGRYGVANALGVVNTSSYFTEVVNYGVIDATATAANGAALAMGAYLTGIDATTLRNYGSITAAAQSDNGEAVAYAALVNGTYMGIGLIVNGGDLAATASGVDATAYGAAVYANVASIFNDGSSAATALADGGDASALAAGSFGIWSAVENTGTLAATAITTGPGVVQAAGARAYGYDGASITNTGGIDAYAGAAHGTATAFGMHASAVIFDAYSANSGDVVAHAAGDAANAFGVANIAGFYGFAVTTNDGSVTAIADGGVAAYGEAEATAFGIYNLAAIYDSVVINDGSVTALATATEAIDPLAGFLQARAIGVLAVGLYGYGDTAIVNSGDTSAATDVSTGYSQSWGAAVQTSGYFGGSALVINDGAIEAYSHVGIGAAVATGVYASNLFGLTEVANYGDIVATASAERGIVNVTVDYAYAAGITAISLYGDTTVANPGYVGAHVASYGAINGATGIQASGHHTEVLNAGTVVATADAEVFGGAFTTGVSASGKYSVDVVNDGTIVAYGTAHALAEGPYVFYGASGAVGVEAYAGLQGDATVVNNGDILAYAHSTDGVGFANAGAGATGVMITAKYDAVVANYGDIVADAETQFGIAGAYGVIGHGKYATTILNAEGANIVATASAGSLAGDYWGGRALAFGTHVFGGDHGTVVNDGGIFASATVTGDGVLNPSPTLAIAAGATVGVYSFLDTADIVNRGDITAVASAGFGTASAYGTHARAEWAATTTNAGDIVASATADQGDAWSTGSLVYGVHRTTTFNCDEYGCDYANPIVTVDGGDAQLANSGSIVSVAYATGGPAAAYGAAVVAGYAAALANTGRIVADAEGDIATAVGALVASLEADATLANGGTILAGAYGPDATAVGVDLVSTGTNTLVNTGTIAALGDGERIAVRSSADAIAAIDNQGTLVGAVVTGDLDDVLANTGLWHAVGTSTFGAGVDAIDNQGTVVLDDAAIDLGAEGDAFVNGGLVAALGGGNVVDLGGAGLFTNDGAITFIDGIADDGLAVHGDFAGTGAIAFDVGGIGQSADWLRIDGDVLAGSAQTLEVRFLDAPTAVDFSVPLVFVSGDSAAGDFALGDVAVAADGFLALAFDLRADIDATNATDDVFSLGVTVTGLNGNGALAAVLAPGAQSLLDAQNGTWRQRQGVLPAHGDDVMAAWVRTFSGSGSVDPGHAGAFGGGDLGFGQSNHGTELGVEARISGRVALGLLLGDSEGRQRLDAGDGTTSLDGRTVGVYGTWFAANGFYLDLSHRWTSLDARLATGTGAYTTTLDATAFNLEAGFQGWQWGAVNAVPQLQVTRTRLTGIDPLQGTSASFADEGGTSLRGRLGVAFDRTFDGGAWSWTPYGSINAVHEFDGAYAHTINGTLEGETRTEGTSALVELGVGARSGNLSVSGGASWMDGGAQQGVTGAQLTLRWRW
jgi:outer membrane autotransporter protein